MTIELKLHKDCQFHTLDANDVYDYIGEHSDKDLELAYYVSMWCEYLNHPLFQNPEYAYADAEYARMGGWLTGYNFAKKITVEEDNLYVKFKFGKHKVILNRPYSDKID